VFVLASVACVLSPGLWWLVGFRVDQAVGVVALTQTSLALLLRVTVGLPGQRADRVARGGGHIGVDKRLFMIKRGSSGLTRRSVLAC
jgi:MFS family permease